MAAERSIQATNSGSMSSLSDSAMENASILADSKREAEAPPGSGWETLRVFMISSSMSYGVQLPSRDGNRTFDG